MTSRRYRSTDVSTRLAELERLCSFDAVELIDDDGACLHATMFADRWRVDLVRATCDDVIELTIATNTPLRYVAYIESLGAMPQRRRGGRRIERRYWLDQIDLRVVPARGDDEKAPHP